MTSTQDYAHKALFELHTGMKGTGKTTNWQKRVKSERAWMKFVFDHQCEFAHRFKIPAVDNPDDLLEKTCMGGYVVFDPTQMFPGGRESTQAGFAWFCEYVLATCKTVGGRKIFACDELQKLVDQRRVPNEFLALCDEGRRHKVDIYAICHGPNLLHNSIRNEVTKIYTYRQMDETSIEYLSKNGLDPQKIRTLPNGKWLCRADTGEISEGGSAF